MSQSTIGAPWRATDAASGLGSAKLATRLAFFIAGFGLACWAPFVPYAKERIGASDAELGSILLFLGIGSVIGMPLAGMLAARLGQRLVVAGGAVGLAIALPSLAFASQAVELAAALLVFGASLGAVDVAANMHGTEVQSRAGKPLMSGFHGLYSVGGLAGAGAVTLALSFGLNVVVTAAAASAIVIVCLLVAFSRFLAHATTGEPHSVFVVPHGIVVLIGVLTGLTFLVEGAVLDWGAIMLADSKQMPVGSAGVGYTAFALAMTVTRIVGDSFVARMGDRMTLGLGSVVTALGVALAAWADNSWVSVAGFAVSGVGAANIVPVLFTLAGRQKAMPSGYAISAVSTLGYLGVFLGPAMIGHVAQAITLPLSFGALAVLMLIVAALAGTVVDRTNAGTGDAR
ncbi:MFS transporter [Aureimonas sp. ME7]|uniref:MFS transporter n=1 Tax=Aureimonas sp. ME7 TaxID=2744252 RepID=UPI0015F3C012|nr:MFS transporter [Aureimonas sp. ME7]